jgi:GntR family transcriptional repressor for pyruvate dehydrogenase complex
MAITKLNTKTLSDKIVDQIKECIISGEWKPGERIPSENDLTKQLNVSRISVRDAIQRLIGMGVLKVRRGEGTFVTDLGIAEYFQSLLPMLMVDKVDLLDMLEFRCMLEPTYISYTVKRISEEQIGYLKETLEKMSGAAKDKDYKQFSKYDSKFHLLIALETHNAALIKVYTIINDMMEMEMIDTVDIVGLEDGLYYHKRILDAIEARDADLSAKCMLEHLQNAYNKVKKFG